MIGGHCENAEIPKQTLVRELQEEIGVTPIQFEHIKTLFDSNNDHTYYVFVVTDWKGEPESLQPEEHEMIGWFSINEALELELALPTYRELFASLEDD
jgi:8-oxo-dGTP diphosphatase